MLGLLLVYSPISRWTHQSILLQIILRKISLLVTLIKDSSNSPTLFSTVNLIEVPNSAGDMISRALSACYPRRNLLFERYLSHSIVSVHYTLHPCIISTREQLIDVSVFQSSMHILLRSITSFMMTWFPTKLSMPNGSLRWYLWGHRPSETTK